MVNLKSGLNVTKTKRRGSGLKPSGPPSKGVGGEWSTFVRGFWVNLVNAIVPIRLFSPVRCLDPPGGL